MTADPAARPANRADWLAAVRAELGARDPKSLDSRVEDGVLLRALGTRADLPATADAAWPPTSPLRLARVVRGPPRAADLGAVDGFEAVRVAGGGVEAALGSGDPTLVRGLDPATAVLTLSAGASGVRALAALHRLGLGHDVVLDVFDKIEGESPARGLALALAAAVDVLRGCAAESLPPSSVSARLLVPVVLDTDVVTGIARVRAARWLWHRVAAAFTGAATPAPARVWARAAPACFSAIDPETNLVRGSLIAFVAMTAGCQVLEPLLFDPAAGGAESQRLAANQIRILRDEAHLLLAHDAAAGSFAVEALTADLAHAAWRMLQAIEANGGAGRTSGGRDALPPPSERSGERVLVGTNRFADPKARVTDAPAGGARPAARFEALRQRTAAAPIATLLLPFSAPDAARAACAFATELLACAGIEPEAAAPCTSVAQARDALARRAPVQVVVCCGEDDADGTFVRSMLAMLAASADPPLLYATGRPAPGSETWGPVGFLHGGLDAAGTLEGILDRLDQRAPR